MARKAVQGYPEKSFYDNTRYLGMIATTDPLQEGFFKHIVNFDISDTGQSVQPRDGFITTTFTNPGSTSLSNKTIIFKSADDSAYIIYDFMQKKGYRADLSAYNLTGQYLPIEATIAEFDWSSFVNYVNLAFSFSNTENELVSALTIVPETKVDFIYDENGIRKALVKVILNINSQTIPLTIQMYYRKDAVTINGTQYANGNVLIFECMDSHLHPTLVSSERNLSVSKSIIPSVFETVYTQNNRPSGHISTLGNFIYVHDQDLNYVNSFIYPNVDYTIKPYFALNPAYLDLNNNVNTDDSWAYRVEIFNTSTEIGDTTKDTILSTPWLKYQGPNKRPTEIFVDSRSNVIFLNNADRTRNHYKSGRYLIYVISKTLNNTTSSKGVSDVGVELNDFPGRASNGTYNVVGGESYNTLTSRNTNWSQIISTITDYKSLIEAINNLSNTAYFYLYDLHQDPSVGKFKSLDELMSGSNYNNSNFENMYYVFDKTTQEDEYNLFLTGDKLVDEIKSRSIFKNKYGIIFHLLPYASNDIYVQGNEFNTMQSNVSFGTQRPYYATNLDNNPPNIDINTLPLNTIVQVIYSGIMYQVTFDEGTGNKVWATVPGYNPTVVPFSNNTWGPTNSDGTFVSTNFFENAIYKDTRTGKFYRWENPTGRLGQFTNINPVVAAEETFRFVVASLNYWSITQDYIVVQNNYLFNKFEMTKYNWDTRKYELSTDLSLLKTSVGSTLTSYPTQYNAEIAYSSDSFGDQPPWYSTTVPNFVASFGTIVQHNNGIYVQTITPSGSNWTGAAAADSALTGNFVQGALYRDQRTGYTYRWDNATGQNGRLTPVSLNVPNLEDEKFFDKGVTMIFYMRPYETADVIGLTFAEQETLKTVWNATALTQSLNLQYGYDALTVTYIEKTLTKEPEQILNSNNQLAFEDSRLLVWNKNVLYISEEGRFYWFKDRNKVEFGEDIVKVLQYKTIILVFTTQHLYAVYRVETTVTTVNPATNQLEQNVTGVAWLKQIVLYNLLVSKEYADVIQVFNEMVLFYSADGQLYMIRPSTTIDNETRFRIQFFNKAVNDVLQNYDVYMNERLAMYAKDTRVTKDQVKIKALVSINFIKMFYYVPGVMTYIVIYDVINNRYTVYDTLTFTNIYDKFFIESGDLYITEQNNKIYFTMHYVEPNVKDNHVDITFTNNFKKEGINALIDTGNLNLNNHLNKRFRDLHVVFKNLNSSNLLFNLETHIDDIVARPFYNEQLEVQEINGASYFVSIPKLNDNDLIELVDVNQISETATDVLKYSLTNNLFENNNVLMDFSAFTSSKLLTHRTSILGLGKVFRFKLQFISKGLYKLQHFGIIYKERRI